MSVNDRAQTRAFDASPIADVQLKSIGGHNVFVGTGYDPQLMIIEPDTGMVATLSPGAYNVLISATVETGRVIRPCLYLDYGRGFGEDSDRRVMLGSLADNQWGCRLDLQRRARQIRFDPSEEPVTLAHMQIQVESRDDRVSQPLTLRRVARQLYHSLPAPLRAALIRSRVPHLFDRILSGRSGKGDPLGELDRITTGAYIPRADGDWSGPLVADYTSRVFTAKGGRVKEYAAIGSEPIVNRSPVKVLAYYLPQMHPIAENDKWWGRGFTEWTNVSKAVAQFDGHYQPKLPGELGFYDLRLPEVMARQIELAKLYGLSGFCFYYYWFDGHRLLEKPIEMFLGNTSAEFDFPFCLCWANENWTRRWDGAESEVLMAQRHGPEDHARVFADLARHFEDKRYIRIDGRPVVLLYRPTIIPDLPDMLAIWREAATARGLPGIFVVATNAFGFDDPETHGFDAICGFPPHGVQAPAVNQLFQLINSEFAGAIFRYSDVVDSETRRLAATIADPPERAAASFPGVMVAWDNEARKPTRGNVFHGSVPGEYHRWLSAAVQYTQAMNPPDRQLVFVNAWNEWAEGAYLEPDRRFGYAYLAATGDVIREAGANKAELVARAEAYNATREKSCDVAICAHLYYPQMTEEFGSRFDAVRARLPIDVLLTVPATWAAKDLERALELVAPTRVIVSDNRGRDVYPFLQALRLGLEMGYRTGCKVHSKKSPQRLDGDAWRQRLFDGLLDQRALDIITSAFIDGDHAIAAPASEVHETSDIFSIRDNLALAGEILHELGCPKAVLDEFVAGTMFWFKFEALAPFARIPDCGRERFGPELGQIDGTLAHAFERVFVPSVKAMGRSVLKYDTRPPATSEPAAPPPGNDVIEEKQS